MHLICFPIYDIDLLLAGFLLSCNCGGQRGGQVDGHAAIHIPRLTGHIRGRIVSRPPPRPAALFACLLSPYMAFALLGLRGLFWVRAGVQHLKLIDNTSKSQFMPDDSQGADKDETLWIKACWRESTGDAGSRPTPMRSACRSEAARSAAASLWSM